MADIRIIAGESRQPRLTVTTDGSTTVNISSGYTVDWHVYREGDPDTVVVDKGTALSGDDDIDVATSGASGIAIVTLTEADTLSLTGTYIYEWRVEEDSSGEVDKTKGRLIVSDSGHGA